MASRTLFAALLSLLFVQSVVAQRAPIRWGDIPAEHLEMTSFAADSNATAVILAKYGEQRHDSQGRLTMDRHVRIKILSEAGFEYGTVMLPYHAEERSSGIRNVRGQTFNLLPDGEVERSTLDRSSIFDENVYRDYGQVRFTLPKLAVGSVIEYSYRQIYDSPFFLRAWRFQSEQPTLYSEMRITLPNSIQYVTATRGFVQEDLAEFDSTPTSGPYGEALRHRMVMKDIPALREEPYMTTLHDYLMSIEFQLSGYRVQRSYSEVLTTWDDVAEEIWSYDMFGRQVGRYREVSALANSLSSDSDELQTLRAIYDHVSQTIIWDRRIGGYIPDQRLPDVLQSKSGSVADINMLLLALLRDAGITSDPVLISTREHGQVHESYPLVSQFNSVIVRAQVDGREWLLDATSPRRPLGMLPGRALNHRGWVLAPEGSFWIDVEAEDQLTNRVLVDAEVDVDGTLTGKMTSQDSGYSALIARGVLAEGDIDSYFRNGIFDDLRTAEISDLEVTNEDDLDQQLISSASFVVKDYALPVGDMMYVGAHLFGKESHNPLRQPDRTFPVDMTYRTESRYILNLRLPEGYELAEVPENVAMTTPSRGASLMRSVSSMGNTVLVQYILQFNQVVFQPEEYHDLQRFFGEVVAAQQETLVLRRVADVEVTESSIEPE